MQTQLLTLLLLLFTQPDILIVNHKCSLKNTITDESCKTEIDSLTNKRVYVTADMLPQNEGGKDALMQRLEKIAIDNIPKDYDPNFIVAFIVDTDGTIIGERVIKDKSNVIGQQMLGIVKEFKWTPAKCGNKNVAMIYKLPLIIDVTEE